MRAEARPPRRKWPWIVSGAAVAALIVAGGLWYANRDNGLVPYPTTPTATAPMPTQVPDVDPTGCLGGEARDAAMVLEAQKLAPHTSNGAVEFATAFMRWGFQYPVPDAEDVDQVATKVIPADSPYDIRASYESNPNTSGALVPDGTPFYLSTVPGVWNLESYSGDEAVVTIGTGIVINGELHPTFRMAKTFTLAWDGTQWMFESTSLDRTTEELYSIGTGFTGGC